MKVYMESKRHLDLRDLAWSHAACWSRMANANWILHGRMQMFSRPFRELIPQNKDGDYCSLNPKAARLILEEKLNMVMRLRNGEGGSSCQIKSKHTTATFSRIFFELHTAPKDSGISRTNQATDRRDGTNPMCNGSVTQEFSRIRKHSWTPL